MPSALDRLHKKTRRAAEATLGPDEPIVTVIEGRSKQAMIVTDRQLLIIKAGLMAGAGFSARVAAFSFAHIAAINVHTGPGVAALEIVVAGTERPAKTDLRAAYQLPNWLPCPRSLSSSPVVGELRAFVQSGGRSNSSRAALSDADG